MTRGNGLGVADTTNATAPNPCANDAQFIDINNSEETILKTTCPDLNDAQGRGDVTVSCRTLSHASDGEKATTEAADTVARDTIWADMPLLTRRQMNELFGKRKQPSTSSHDDSPAVKKSRKAPAKPHASGQARPSKPTVKPAKRLKAKTKSPSPPPEPESPLSSAESLSNPPYPQTEATKPAKRLKARTKSPSPLSEPKSPLNSAESLSSPLYPQTEATTPSVDDEDLKVNAFLWAEGLRVGYPFAVVPCIACQDSVSACRGLTGQQCRRCSEMQLECSNTSSSSAHAASSAGPVRSSSRRLRRSGEG